MSTLKSDLCCPVIRGTLLVSVQPRGALYGCLDGAPRAAISPGLRHRAMVRGRPFSALGKAVDKPAESSGGERRLELAVPLLPHLVDAILPSSWRERARCSIRQPRRAVRAHARRALVLPAGPSPGAPQTHLLELLLPPRELHALARSARAHVPRVTTRLERY